MTSATDKLWAAVTFPEAIRAVSDVIPFQFFFCPPLRYVYDLFISVLAPATDSICATRPTIKEQSKIWVLGMAE